MTITDPITLLILAHIVSGTIATIAGALALAVRKGRTMHIATGQIFALAMIISSALGAGLGLIKATELYITFHAGVLGVTLILGSLFTARARTSNLGLGSMLVGGINFLNGAGLISAGVYALSKPDGLLFGFHAENYFFLSMMATFTALADISLLVRKRLSERHRIARHLWRMCLGFFIAAGSAFTGPGAKVFPEALRETGVLSLPELVIFILMLFWLIRTVFGQREPVESH